MILVTGGTGFVGRHLVKRLLAEGHEVTCLVRPSSKKREALLASEVQRVEGDVSDTRSVIEAAKGCHTVYSLVGLLYEPPGYTFEMVHAAGVLNIVRACKAAGIKRLIHISALGTSPEAESRYHKTKLAGEKVIIESGLDYTIFRPSVIFGEDDAFINLFASLIGRLPAIGIIGNGQYRMQPVYIEDLITCMVQSLDRKQTLKETYEIGGGEVITFNEIMSSIAAAMGKKRLFPHIPLMLARPMARVMELFPKPLITTDQLTMLLKDNICDNSKVSEAFDMQFKGFTTEVARLVKRPQWTAAPAGDGKGQEK